MGKSRFELALEAAFKGGYEQGFSDRDHSADRDAGGSWKHWAGDSGEQILCQAVDADLQLARALSKLRVAMVPLRSAYTHTARVEALNRVDSMLLMLKHIGLVDAFTWEVLLSEIRDADRKGASRCEAKHASGAVSRCMHDDAIYVRANTLMSLQEALNEVRQAPTMQALELSCIEVEDQLMKAFPAYVDEDELVEWRIFIGDAKSQRLQELA